jgi:hypothetical protein
MSASRDKAMAAFLELKKAHPRLSLEELTPLWCAKVRSDPELIDAVYEWAFDNDYEEAYLGPYGKAAPEGRGTRLRKPN